MLSIEKSLLYVIRNPATVIPGAHPDIARRTAAADLAAMAYSANVFSVPQSSSEELRVTISALGGNSQTNVDSFGRVEWPIIELATWLRLGANRANRQDVIDLGKRLNIVLHGLRGTFEGLEIKDISTEVDPFTQEDIPGDGSDQWIAGYTYTYIIQHGQTSAPDHRIAVGVDGP